MPLEEIEALIGEVLLPNEAVWSERVAQPAPGMLLKHYSPRAKLLLVAHGLIETRPGAGTFVRAVRTARPLDFGWQTAAMRSPSSHLGALNPALRAAPQGSIALHSGYPDRDLLPERPVRSARARAARGSSPLSPQETSLAWSSTR